MTQEREKLLLLVLLLSVGNDVHQVLVVQVSCHIWREGGEHLLHLTNRKVDVITTYVTASGPHSTTHGNRVQ